MKIQSVEMENWQSHTDEMVPMPEGTIFIRGGIGSGKSSLLRAIFCGLFQSDATNVIPGVDSLDELVQFDKDRARINIVWEVNDDLWEVEWVLSCSGTGEDRSASTDSCTLRGAGTEINGVRDVSRKIQEDILQMDAESFVNSVYVQQKEMRRLLDSSQGKRTEVLDALLGLDKIDEYRSRMKNARPAATSARDDAESRIDEISSQLQDLENLEDLKEQKRELESDISDLQEDISEKKSELQELREDKQAYVDKQESIESLKEEKHELEEDISDLNGRISSHENRISEWKSERQELEEENRSFDPLSEDLDPDQLDDLQNRRDDLKDQLTRHKTELESLETHVEPEEVEERIRELQGYITRPVPEVETELEGARDQRETELRELDAQIERVEVQLSQIGKIEETGECPVCERSVDDHRDESELESRLSELESRRDQREAELDSQISQLKQELEEQEALQEDLGAAQEKLETVREDQTAAEEHTEEINRLEDELPVVESKIEKIEEFIDNQETKEANESRIEEITDMLEGHESQLSQMRSDVETKQERISEIESEIPEDTDYQEKIAEKEGEIESLKEDIEGLEEDRTELQEGKTKTESSISQIQGLQSRMEAAQRRRDKAQSIRDETEEMLEIYSDVKLEMRRENVRLLNRYTNELFRELYRDENYEDIKISPEYDIKMVRDTGAEMDPSLASGGERAILNLALRAAVYRLVSEKDSRIGQLPPFILDEPTQGMDSEHVRQLGRLVEQIEDWDVSQLFIVSHENEIEEMTEHVIDV